ncbi:hypothetical protein BDW75DRAFT_150928 [Aspergillus navahoensis]
MKRIGAGRARPDQPDQRRTVPYTVIEAFGAAEKEKRQQLEDFPQFLISRAPPLSRSNSLTMGSPRSPRTSSSSTPTSSSISSPLLYPSSCSSADSVPRCTTNLRSPSPSPHRLRTRNHLESLIAKHGRPTRFSLSSLDELTATCSTYSPPSPLSRSRSPAAELSDPFEKDSVSNYQSRSRPIPIPRSYSAHREDIPVTPLTGRFERDYFPHRDISPERNIRKLTRPRHRHYYSDRDAMRSDTSTFYSPVASTMSSSGLPDSPQQARAQTTAKSAPTFHLGDLPRFHPAVYQSSGHSQSMAAPPSPRQSRQNVYRPASSSRDPVSQYREFFEGVVLQKPVSRPLSPSPAAPRLNPLNSPGPVTPLALEEAGGYLSAGSSNRSELSRELQRSAPAPDLLERLIARENDRARQKARKATKGW